VRDWGQTYLKLKPGTTLYVSDYFTPKALAFDFVSATNLKSPATGHQHHLVIQFEDANHITETWTWREGEMDMPMTFHLNRKK